MKKKLSFILLTVFLLLSACSTGNSNSASEDGEAPSGGQVDITVSVMRKMPFLETAARKFHEKHPNVNIHFKENIAVTEVEGEGGMMAAVSTLDIEKYIQTVTTEILAGKASDMILMDSLPQDKLVQKNALVNLYDWMEKDVTFDKSQYYGNIMKAAQDSEGLYGLPLSFYLEGMISGNEKLLKEANITIDDEHWTWDQFKDIAKKLREVTGEDTEVLSNAFPGVLLSDFIEGNYAKLVSNNQANFDSELFRGMMNQIKAMFDEGILTENFSYDQNAALFTQGGYTEPETAIQDMLREDAVFYKKPTYDGQSNGISYRSGLTLAINSKSKFQKEAWEFLKFLLSDEMQASTELGGYPINKAQAAAKLEATRKSVEKEQGIDDKKSKALDEGIKQLNEMLGQAGTKATSDMKVIMTAMNEFQAFISGQKSAEDVSKLIQNKVNTYLNE
ncbi:ABC transporter substrate-binding protein [Paenibacillus sp. 1001270B_150601_E10]|uniref:ABC transporter substrate-binding protein n=1 Tax=Paenibacillus sp. 1001270B_150601_E10 TaxID=2787079 RepID=UPI0018A0517A|nr:ABC transporter substrate-binding protein [Paenibacillus sp. 1001270B_150601_E10]